MRARSTSPFGRGLSSFDEYRFLRSRSVDPSTHRYRSVYYDGIRDGSIYSKPLRSTTPYLPHGVCDYDVYDRFSERCGRRTPIYYSSTKRNYFTPSYWYHRTPRTAYYPFGGWTNRLPSTYLQRTSIGTHYPFYAPSDSYVWRYVESLDRIGALNCRVRDLDYNRALRALQFRHSAPSNFYSSIRDDVETSIRYGSMDLSRSDNPRRYYGVSYIKNEKTNADVVKNRYKYLMKSADQKPASWHAEDQVETGYDLQNINTDTLPSILNTGYIAEHSRREMLMDKAGVVPRLERLKTDYIFTKSSTDYSKRLVQNLKKLKDETFTRLSEPWKYGQYS